MRDYFEGNSWIYLEPQDLEVPYTFTVTVNTSATANDGFLPYDTNISAITAVAYDSEDNVVTTDLIDTAPTVSSNVITIHLKYPSTNGVDIYKLSFKLILDNAKATVKELDFVRIRALNV